MARDLLSDLKVKNAKGKSRLYTLNDGAGLCLEVTTTGSKRWRFRFRFDGKYAKKSFGLYPDVSLEMARDKRNKAKTSIVNKVHPFRKEKVQGSNYPLKALSFNEWKDEFFQWKELKNDILKLDDKEKLKRLHKKLDDKQVIVFNRFTTFKQWTEFYKFKVAGTVTDRHIERSAKGWNKYTFPVIGDTPMNDIFPRDVLKIMNIMNDKNIYESARKVFSSIKRIFEVCFASFPDEIDFNPCSSIKLADVLTEKETVHYPKIVDPKELGFLLNAISDYKGDTSTRLGLLFIAHTAVRPNNVRMCKWEDINLVERIWTIPTTDMKMSKEHKVPLSDQTIAILEEAALCKGTKEGIVFNSPKSKISPMSDGTLVNGLRRMGYTKEELSAHSFRGIFSTICHDRRTSRKYPDFNYDKDVIEMCLAHSVKSSVESAYNEADYFDMRAEVMQWYSSFLEDCQNAN